ncbi:MAG: MTAP family purine nucleoside phosphorylase [Syntrophales bacterium]|jgi:5'-methylthioadenosine phosphorylase
MAPLGIITGTISFKPKNLSISLKKRIMTTPFGGTTVFYSNRLIMIPRHGVEAGIVIPPHRINHLANIHAFKVMGCHEIVGLHSTGSMNMSIPPGSIVVPDDFICLGSFPTVFEENVNHIVPSLSRTVRKKILNASKACGLPVKDGGTYWQTRGPRLETPAEIKMMAQFADLIAMTMASEAISASEFGLRYASLCSVDNYANGITDRKLTMESIRRFAHRNTAALNKIILRYLEMYSS